jgi:hypothetical protein
MYSVVGITFRPDPVQAFYFRIQSGDVGYLQREPSNPYDPDAVRVLALDSTVNKFVFIGYLPKGMSKVFKKEYATIKFIENRRFEILDEYDNNPKGEIINANQTESV